MDEPFDSNPNFIGYLLGGVMAAMAAYLAMNFIRNLYAAGYTQGYYDYLYGTTRSVKSKIQRDGNVYSYPFEKEKSEPTDKPEEA